jgi:hypothetical protein
MCELRPHIRMLWRGRSHYQGRAKRARWVALTVTPPQPYSCSGGRSGPPRTAIQGHFTHKFCYRAVVRNAMTRLQGSFNGGHCDQIYDEASDAFQQRVSPSEWLAGCKELRSRVGSRATLSFGPIVWKSLFADVRATATVSGASVDFHFTWFLQNGRAGLIWLRVRGGDLYVAIPRWTPPIPLVDPPPRRHTPPQR